jgi:hypothetical protein
MIPLARVFVGSQKMRHSPSLLFDPNNGENSGEHSLIFLEEKAHGTPVVGFLFWVLDNTPKIFPK